MEIFSLCGGICCYGAMLGGWLAISKAAKLPTKATVIGSVILSAPFCLASMFVGKYVFLDEQLITASYDGDLPRMESLLNMGADPNVLGEFERPICAAFANQHHEAVKLLVKRGANVNVECSTSTTSLGYPLDIAANRKDQDLVDFLKKHGAKRKP